MLLRLECREITSQVGRLYSPYATRDAPRMVDANELVAGGSDVKVRLLLVDEEGVGYPDVLDEFRADAERLDARALLER